MFVSMWISNTAAVAMMCPIMQAVLEELQSVNTILLTELLQILNKKYNTARTVQNVRRTFKN